MRGAWPGQSFSQAFASTIKVWHPNSIVFDRGFWLFSFLNILRLGSESSVKTFLIWVIIFPLLCLLPSVLLILFFLLVGFITIVDSIIWSESLTRMRTTPEPCWNLCFMYQSFVGIYCPLVIFWIPNVWIAPKKMPNGDISKTFFHVISHDSFKAGFYFSVFSPSIVNLITILFFVFEL